MCSIRLSSFLLPYDLACSGGKKLMPIHVSAELSHICPLEDITAHAAVLESGGFYRVWVPDTVVSPWEAWLAASLVMQTTSRVRIGLGVTNPYTRHPVVKIGRASCRERV